jgi:hypothetical protein
VNIPLDIRTEYSSVPSNAKSEAQGLFVKEVRKWLASVGREMVGQITISVYKKKLKSSILKCFDSSK